jgi:hypothetical protein
MKSLRPLFPLLILLLFAGLLRAAEPTLPTAIKYIDGAITLIGFDPTDKERVVKLRWADVKDAKPIPGEPKSFRKEIDLTGFSDASQRSMIAAVNRHGFFAVGLSPKNAGEKQTYDVFETANAPHTPVGKANTVPPSND